MTHTQHTVELPAGLPSDPREMTRDQYMVTVKFLTEKTLNELRKYQDAHQYQCQVAGRAADRAKDDAARAQAEFDYGLAQARLDQVTDAVFLKVSTGS